MVQVKQSVSAKVFELWCSEHRHQGQQSGSAQASSADCFLASDHCLLFVAQQRILGQTQAVAGMQHDYVVDKT